MGPATGGLELQLESGSYRAVLWLGGTALVALVPLALAQRRVAHAKTTRTARPRPATVAAVIPVFASQRAVDVARAALRHVDQVVLVDDGAPAPVSATRSVPWFGPSS